MKLLLSFLLLTSLCFGDIGKVVGVHDGDTVTVLTDKKEEVKIRLWGIDSPELGQAFGKNAKEELSRLAFGKMVTYVVVVRHEKEKDLFNKLHSLRYQLMARLSPDAQKPFDDIHKVLGRIFSASHMLGTHYWKRQGRVQMGEAEFERHLKKMQEQEAIFWAGAESPDPIAVQVDEIIENIEKLCRPLLDEKSVGFILFAPVTQFLRWRRHSGDKK